MEHQVVGESIDTSFEDDDVWLRTLEATGEVAFLGPSNDPCKVIAPSEDVWRRGRIGDRHTGTLVAKTQGLPSRTRGSDHSTSPHLQDPTEFLDALKRRLVLTRIGPFFVPDSLREIANRVVESQSIVEAEGRTHGDPNAVLPETWKRAANFILDASKNFWTTRQLAPPVPAISADMDRGIDVVWRSQDRSLYLNFPEEPNNVVTYYGRDRKNPVERLGGEADSEENGEWFFVWLIR
jgi:hypothetical protein